MSILFSKKALEKTLRFLEQCESALFSHRSSSDVDSRVLHWETFLLAAGRIIHAIEGECNRSPQGRQWYGGERNAARKSPFLQYMYQARNITEHQPSSDSVSVTGDAITLKNISIKNDGPEPMYWFGPGGLVDHAPGRVTLHPKLLAAMDDQSVIEIIPGDKLRLPDVMRDTKRGNEFPFPESHLGLRLDPFETSQVGELYFKYLRDLIGRIPL